MLGSESTTASAKSVHVNSGVPGQLASFFSASFAQSSAASGNAVLNINFTSGGPEKFGFAAIGQSGADLWNTYQFPGQFFGELTDLVWSDGSPSQVAVQVANAPGGWGNGVDDEMYGSYIYPHNGGDVLVSLTNLPAGNYDFYIYGHGPSDDGNTIVELWSGASSFGQRGTTVCGSMWNSTEWEVGQQYVLYRNVSVAEGATVTIDVMPNAPGWAIINGMQIVLSGSVQQQNAPIEKLINVNFTGGTSDKVGLAAVGVGPTDAWNNYKHPGELFAQINNLVWSDNTASAATLTVENAPGLWGNGTTDPMYNPYIYTYGSAATITYTGLPTAQYDVYVYGHGPSDDGSTIVELSTGTTSHGRKGTSMWGSAWNSTQWEEGQHYVAYRNVELSAGEALQLTVFPGPSGYSIISGVQLVLPFDRDEDGLADSWERQYFGNLNQSPSGDPDEDQLTNLNEYRLGYDPTTAYTGGSSISDSDADYDGDQLSNIGELTCWQSDPANPNTFNPAVNDAIYLTTATPFNANTQVRLDLYSDQGAIKFVISRGKPGAAYDIYWQNALIENGPWELYYSGALGQTDFWPPLAPGMGYFRVGLASDRDGDGLTDGYEAFISKTAIDRPLTDFDSLRDGWEVEYGLNPLKPLPPNPPPAGDSDGDDGDMDADQSTNLQEQTNGTDPKRNNSGQQRPVISITAIDPTAEERPGDPAQFRITRTGASGPVTVLYTIGGTALYGTDYQLSPSPTGPYPAGFAIVVPGGQIPESSHLTVTALADALAEGPERVAIAVVPSPDDSYVVDPNQNVAVASIRDLYCRTYTLNADFDRGRLVGVNHDIADQLQLNNSLVRQYPYINVACSGRGTVARIDEESGEVVGEYWTSPAGRGRSPSRTTVDQYGNVWVANRAEGDANNRHGSITRIALVMGGKRCNADGSEVGGTLQYLKNVEYTTAIDRDGDGLIKTSRGLDNILPWPSVEDSVSTAEDELITEYVFVNSFGTRTLAVDRYNDVWVGGIGSDLSPDTTHEKVDGLTGQPVLNTLFELGCGGYGGVIDQQGNLWSADRGGMLLRFVPNSQTPPGTGECLSSGDYGNYGLAIDPNLAPGFQSGFLWYTRDFQPSGGFISKIRPDGTVASTHVHGGDNAQGVVVDDNGHVWVAHAKQVSRTVGHLNSAGTLLGLVTLDATVNVGPTGLAVDSRGRIWVGCEEGNNAMRIDPSRSIAGEVDKTVPLGTHLTHSSGLDAAPYNYSDMTGFNNHLVNPAMKPFKGYWAVVDDSAVPGMIWDAVSWRTPASPSGRIEVSVRAADTRLGLYSKNFERALNGTPLLSTKGRFLEVRVALVRDLATENPVLEELTVCGKSSTLLITSQPQNQLNVPEGQNAEFSVVASGTDPLTYQWHHNNQQISGATSSALNLADIHCLDEGAYHVTIQDASGSVAESQQAFLTMDAATVTILNRGAGTYPYPATLRVSGLLGTISAVTVTINSLSHTLPSNLGMLLVSPGGQSVLLMSNAGGTTPVPEDPGVTITFDDGASGQIPTDIIFSGTFRPSAILPTPTLPAPAPAPPYQTTLSSLNGASPNGIWQLYVYDFGGGTPTAGKIDGSWCLAITGP